MDSEADLFAALRNDFNFAYISEFMHHFSSAFFTEREDEKPTSPFLEHLLLYQDDPKKIGNFYLKLIKALPGWRTVNYDTWFEGLAKEYKKRELEVDFPSPAPPSTILTIPLKQRLQMLRNLCDFHLEQCEHFWELCRAGDAEEALRVESIGIDAQNRRYWIFSDARMYRDRIALKNVAKAQESIEDESNWELVCLTRADYDEFLQNGLSSKPKDRALIKLINQEWMPDLEKTLNYQLAQHRKYFRPVNSRQEVLLPRKRSSRLVEKEIMEMQQREIEEAARKERERELREMRAALIGRDFNLPPTVPEDTADLALQRELRARERELKKEKEAQVRAIEEAFYSQLVDVEEAEPAETEKHSPIKLVLKLNSLQVKTVPAEVVDMLQSKEEEEVVDILSGKDEEVLDIVSTTEQAVDIESVENSTSESTEQAVNVINTESAEQAVNVSNTEYVEQAARVTDEQATTCSVPTEQTLAVNEQAVSVNTNESTEQVVVTKEQTVNEPSATDQPEETTPVEHLEDSRDVAELLSSQFSQ